MAELESGDAPSQVSLPVRFRQWDSDICHTIPGPQHDLEVGMLGSIPAALISPITQFLPYANYDDTETWEPIANLREDVPGLLSRFQQKQRQKRGKCRADVGEADPN